jgi:hypothetical protein
MSLPANAYNSAVRLVREHVPALIVAVVVGLATGAPQFLVIHSMGAQYEGIFPETTGDDRYYQARSHEIRDGYPFLGNPYIYELRNDPSVSFWIPDAIPSYAGMFFGVDVQHTFAIFDFLLPPLLFLGTYGIFLYLTGRRLASLLVATVFHLGLFLTTFIRSPSPQVNFFFVEFALYALIRFVKNAPYRWHVLGVSLGILFYVYPYYWTFMYGVVGMFFLLSFARKELRPMSLPLFCALTIGTIIGLPVLLQTLGSHSSEYTETLLRLGQIRSRTPAGFASIAMCLSLISFLALCMWRITALRRDIVMWLFASASLGALFASNNQIVLGTNLEYSSHYFLPVAYLIFLAFAYTCLQILKILPARHYSYVWKGILIMTIFATALGGALDILRRVQPNPELLANQRYAPILAWLRTNTPKDSVVLTDEVLSSFIPAYTDDRIFYSRNANLHVMSDKEAWTRFLLEYRGVHLSDSFLDDHIGQIWGAHPYDVYGHILQLNKLRKFLGLTPLPAVLVSNTMKMEFRNFAIAQEKEPVQKILGSRRIDYVMASPEFPVPIWIKDLFPNMREVFQYGQLVIYSLQ